MTTGFDLTENSRVFCPAETVTDDGVWTAGLDEDKVTLAPPAGAFSVSSTRSVIDRPPVWLPEP
jgi:hypothetical protein